MFRRALPLLLLSVLVGCGGDDEPAPRAEPTSDDSAFVETTPSPTPAASPTANVTGPSGETPRQRRDRLGGCPSVPGLTRATTGPTVICSYSGGEVQVEVGEPVGLPESPDLAGYRATVQRNNPTPPATGLGPGAFYSYVEESPEVCAVWFVALDGKVLTASAIKSGGTTAGPRSASCTLALDVARDFRRT